jgi:thiol-disulfide isomerase/thioredoxin
VTLAGGRLAGAGDFHQNELESIERSCPSGAGFIEDIVTRPKPYHHRAFFLALGVLIAAGLSWSAWAGDSTRPMREAHEFAYEDINPNSATHGQTIALRDLYLGEGLVLNFIASWCPPCWAEVPSFQKLSRSASTPVVFIAADELAGAVDVLKRAKQAGIQLPILLVPKDEIGLMEEFYDHSMLPSTYMISNDGHIKKVFEGMISEGTLFRETARQYPDSGVEVPADTRRGSIKL